MKLGTENKTKTGIAVALLIVAAFFVFRALHGGGDDSPAPPPATSATGTATRAAAPAAHDPAATRRAAAPLLARTLDPSLRFDLLKSSEDVKYEGNGRDIFRAEPEPAPIPKPLPPEQQPKATPPPPPPPPPINLKFYGLASRKDGYKRVFASRGEDIFIAKEGDIVDRRYKILHIGTNSVDVEDVLTNNKQTLPLNAG